MRQAIALVLMIALLLTGCSAASGDTERFAAFRGTVAAAGEISARAVVVADFGDKVHSYTLQYTQNADGVRVEILEPELLRGITARVDGADTHLEFDGLILDTGELDGDGLTPMSALPAIVESIRSGHVESNWREKDGDNVSLVFEVMITDETSQNLWLDAGSMLPQKAELLSGGRVVITCQFQAWSAK